jgi:hypothetical protein
MRVSRLVDGSLDFVLVGSCEVSSTSDVGVRWTGVASFDEGSELRFKWSRDHVPHDRSAWRHGSASGLLMHAGDAKILGDVKIVSSFLTLCIFHEVRICLVQTKWTECHPCPISLDTKAAVKTWLGPQHKEGGGIRLLDNARSTVWPTLELAHVNPTRLVLHRVPQLRSMAARPEELVAFTNTRGWKGAGG